MTSGHCQFMTSRLPGSLKQTQGSGCLSWQPNDSAWFSLRCILWPRFILSLLVLMQSSFYNLKTYLYWQKHYDITNSSVQYCIAFWILLATGVRNPGDVGHFFTSRHSGHHVNIYYCGNILIGHVWRQAIVSLWRLGCLAPSNKRKAAGACHGNLTTLRGFAWGAFCGHGSS